MEEATRGWSPEYAGLKVRLRDNPGRAGVTTGRTKQAGSFLMVEVDFGPNEKQFKRYDLLEPVEEDQELFDLLARGKFGGPSDLRRVLTFEKIKGDLTNVFYSMEASNTDFYAHQFKPVMRFIELAACRERGIRVANTPDVLTDDVADLAVGMMLALGRGVVPGDHWVRSGAWREKGPFPLMHRVHGRRAGIMGLGRIGQAVGRRLAGFDIPIAYFSRARKSEAGDWEYFDSPVELAGWAEVLFVTLAATSETRHIVGRQVLDALGPKGILINVSRAANVDEKALLDALENRSVGGAALDVFENEPALDPRFVALDNVLLQPHQGSGTVETRKAMGQLMRDNLSAHFAGQPLLTPVV